MSGLTCAACGKTTTAPTSDCLDSPRGTAALCYAAFEGGRWVAGCAYDQARPHLKMVMRRILGIPAGPVMAEPAVPPAEPPAS